MADEDDYYWVTGKVSRFDNDGNPVTNETLGSGGSRRDDGTFSSLAFDLHIIDDDVNSDPDATDGPSDDLVDERDTLVFAVAALAAVVFAGGVVVVVKKWPEISAWWRDSARPALGARLNRILGNRLQRTPVAALEAAPAVVDPAEVAATIDVLDEDPETVMSSAEAKRRYVSMVVALVFAAEQFRALRSARIEDVEELGQLAERLTTQSSLDMVNAILELEPALLDHQTQLFLLESLGGGAWVGADYMPIQRERMLLAVHLGTVPGQATHEMSAPAAMIQEPS